MPDTDNDSTESVRCYDCDVVIPEVNSLTCQRRYSSGRTCYWCVDCCEQDHWTCESCDRHLRSDPPVDCCGYCGPCCTCDEDDGSSYHCNPGRPWHATDRSDRREFPSARLCGIEVEFNHARDLQPLREWRDAWRAGWHDDGSCGEELVTAPLAGDHIGRCLTELDGAIKSACAVIDSRCGVHVHVDAGDFYWHDLFRLLKVYAKVESALYMLGDQKRVKSRWCVPQGDRIARALASDDPKNAVLGLVYGRGSQGRAYMRGYWPDKKDGVRYVGLNLSPWVAGRRRRGPKTHKPGRSDTTVEFRIHGNTSDMTRVANWARLLVSLVDYAAKASDAEIEALPRSAVRALCQIAPRSATWILKEFKAWRNSTYTPRGATVAQVCYCDACASERAATQPTPAPTKRAEPRNIRYLPLTRPGATRAPLVYQLAV